MNKKGEDDKYRHRRTKMAPAINGCQKADKYKSYQQKIKMNSEK